MQTEQLTGRALDVAVAETLGCKVEMQPDGPYCKCFDGQHAMEYTNRLREYSFRLREYSTNIAAAWGLVDLVKSWHFADRQEFVRRINMQAWQEKKASADQALGWLLFHDNPAHAICRAFLAVRAGG